MLKPERALKRRTIGGARQASGRLLQMADERLVVVKDSVAEKSQTPRCEMLIDRHVVM
jgi:hypothetical protein